MNLDQRNDDQQIRSGELPVVAGPSEDLSVLSADDEFEETRFSKWILPISLFVATIFTTLWAGAYQAYNGPIHGPVNFLLEHPETLWRGFPLAATLLIILVTHECGHYVLSRIHGVPASLPLFIPGPPYFIGTFGAIIRLRGPIVNRRALFDIGVSGPLAGFIVAVVALVIGLKLSTVVDRTATHGLQLGEPLLLQFISWLVVGSLPPQADIVLHPIGFAAWFGLFVTSLNLPSHRPTRRRACGVRPVGLTPTHDGVCHGAAVDRAGVRGLARLVALGIHGRTMGFRTSAGARSSRTVGPRTDRCRMDCICRVCADLCARSFLFPLAGC